MGDDGGRSVSSNYEFEGVGLDYPEGYRIALRQFYVGRWPVLRLGEEVAVIVLPIIHERRLSMHGAVGVCVRVQYMGE